MSEFELGIHFGKQFDQNPKLELKSIEFEPSSKLI
jgi:hypothetical protein